MLGRRGLQFAERYAFGPFVLDTSRLALFEGDREIDLRPKAFETLLALLLDAGRVVSKDQLVATVWPNVIVNDDALAQCVRDVRKAIADTDHRYIRTVPRRGYMFVHPVSPTSVPVEQSLNACRTSISPAIAVMPFANLSSDPEQAFFADGVVEDLITALSRFKTFAVVSRSSSFVYKDRAVDARVAARELGVRYLLGGSVRRSGDRIRVTAQLIEGATGAHLWAEKFDGAPTDMFEFHDMITDTVIGLIEPQIRKAEIERARQKRPESLDAWDLYVQALPLVHSAAVANYSRAIELLDRAVLLEPTYSPALALKAWAHNKREHFGGSQPPESGADRQAAFELAERAVAADPDDALALALFGLMRIFYKSDFAGLDLVRRAIALNPNSTSVAEVAGSALIRASDNLDEVLATCTRAFELTPQSSHRYVFLVHIAAAHNAAGRYEEAIVFGKRLLALEPSFVNGHVILAIAYAQLGRIEEARQEVAAAIHMRPDITIAAIKPDRMRFPERAARWVEGLRKAGLPE